MKMWNNLTLVTAMLAMSVVAQADTLGGIYASVDYWAVQGNYNDSRRVGDALDVDDVGLAQFAVSIEHPVPLVPNVRIRHVTMDVDTQQKIAGQPTYNVDVNNTDVIAYYELLDNVVSVDAGVAAKALDGDIQYLGIHTWKLSETVPMLYGSVGGKLPFTGLSTKAEALISVDNQLKVSDVSAEVKYDFIDTLLVDVGAKVGYRILDVDLSSKKSLDNKFRFDGVYAGLEVHF
ncbi:MAG: TIGR04219 family outer membrane beta-barrel protein [Acinetobacter sp.]|nr:MAG: TIGR04219 family outer membrane beta-barrel protein [Acinetobacter sp.]